MELVVRADGGPGTGVGHLARCLALTQAWTDWGGRATLVSSSPPEEWAERYRREGATVCDPAGVDSVTGAGPAADWAVLDGYRFGADDEEMVRKAARHLLVIADHGEGGEHGADLVVDQNLDATVDRYLADALAGARYALLRRQFRSPSAHERDVPGRARRLLLALGGSPPEPVVALVRDALEHPSLGDVAVTRLEGVDDVAGAMAGADITLSASGSTCWELCRMGVPAVVLPVARNQEPLAAALERNRVAVHAGSPAALTPADLAAIVAALADDPARRAEMARLGPRLVDGQGARRVATRMRSHLLDLRPVRDDDARLLWDWVNDADVRASSFDSGPIGWETHVRWLADRLGDPNAHLYLATHHDGRSLGQVRFDDDRTRSTISVSVAPSFRGGGWGGALVDAGVRRLFVDTAVDSVVAEIKPDNARSHSAFVAADFDRLEDTGDGIVRYVRRRSSSVR